VRIDAEGDGPDVNSGVTVWKPLQALYDSEIKVTITMFWDGGFPPDPH
jgi:hypothetical protein